MRTKQYVAMLLLLALAQPGHVGAEDDDPEPRTLGSIQQESVHITLIGEKLDIDSTRSNDCVTSVLGVTAADVTSSKICPVSSDDSDKSSEEDYIHYRILGVEGSILFCDSVLVLLTNAEATETETTCEIPNTYKLKIPIDIPTPYARIEFGRQLVDDDGKVNEAALRPSPQLIEDCGCETRGCDASIRVRREGNGLRVTGDLNCGVDCDIDVRLTPSDPRSEFKCTAGRLRTKVRLTLDDGCVKAEGKACVKDPFGNWQCSGWNNLGRFCP